MGAGTSVIAHGPIGAPPRNPQDNMMGRATRSMRHFGEVFGAAASEAYVPRMMYQECTPEDPPGPFPGPGWEEEVLGAEAFQSRQRAPPAVPLMTDTGYH